MDGYPERPPPGTALPGDSGKRQSCAPDSELTSVQLGQGVLIRQRSGCMATIIGLGQSSDLFRIGKHQ